MMGGEPDDDTPPCAFICTCGRCDPKKEEKMAAEDYLPDFDDDGWHDLYSKYHVDEYGYMTKNRFSAARQNLSRAKATLRKARLAEIDGKPAEGVEVGDLLKGETFKFVNPTNPNNIYMVVDSKPGTFDEDFVYYVLLNTGEVYCSRPTKRVVQVGCSISSKPLETKG